MLQRSFIKISGVVLVGFLIIFPLLFPSTSNLALPAAASRGESAIPAAISSARGAANPHIFDLYSRRPLSFERNDGQTDAQVKFLSRGEGYTLFLTPTEAVLALRKPPSESIKAKRPSSQVLTKAGAASTNKLSPAANASAVRAKSLDRNPNKIETEALHVNLIGANSHAEINGVDRLRGKSNYFIGNDPKQWHTDVPNFAKVELKRVYPGIDLIYYGSSQSQLEYDFRLAPGADPNTIRLNFGGENKLGLDDRGNLIVTIGGQKLIEHTPAIYQETGHNRQTITGGWKLRGAHEAGFQVAAYDRTQPLTIDPVLAYSTYFGGSGLGNSAGYGIAVDSAHNAYFTGTASPNDFPVTPGAFQTVSAGAFVAKLNPGNNGEADLLYSTYLGGHGNDSGAAIAVDSAGNAYVTGTAGSTDFPTTAGAFQHVNNNAGGNAFVTKLSATGSSLLYSTYLGGGSDSTFLGGGGDGGTGIAVDSAGNAYVTGNSESISNVSCTGAAFPQNCCTGPGTGTCIGFPTTASAFQSVNNAAANVAENVFVAKLNPAASGAASLIYSTYLGGSGGDDATLGDDSTGIAVDSSGNAYVTGGAHSTNFPTTAGAFQSVNKALGICNNAFVAKLNPAASGPASLIYSTYLGGGLLPSGHHHRGGPSCGDFGYAIAVDPAGHAYVTGQASYFDFPVTAGAFQSVNNSGENAFVTKLNPGNNGAADLLYSTYLGGGGSDIGYGIAIDSTGNADVTGTTASSINNASCTAAGTPALCCTGAGTGTCIGFPTTAGAFQSVNNGAHLGPPNAFVAKLDLPLAPTPSPTPKPTPSPSPSPTPTPIKTPTPTPTATATPTVTPTPTSTPSITPTPTPRPTPTPTPSPGTIAVAPAAGLPFANVGTDTLGKTKNLTIKNSAKKGELTGTVGALSSPYSVTVGGGAFDLLPGVKKTVTVQFAPTAAGSVPAMMAIRSNDPKRPLVNVKLSGTGAAGKLAVPAHLAFLPVKVGATSAAKKLTIKNSGLGVLHGNVNPATGPFAVTSGAGGFTLDSKQSRAVTIQFMPTAKGPAIGGTVPITSDDPNHLSFTVNLKGTGK